MASEADTMASVLGRSKRHTDLAEYKARDEYADQDDVRVVKDLMFTYHVLEPNPTLPALGDMVVERIGKRGDILDVEELGPMFLEKGERLGSFFTTEELKAMRGPEIAQTFRNGVPEEISDLVGVAPAPEEGAAQASFSEMGAHELAEYLETERPNVAATVAMAEGDPETAKRLLEAENIATDNDPRQGVVDGLARIIGED